MSIDLRPNSDTGEHQRVEPLPKPRDVDEMLDELMASSEPLTFGERYALARFGRLPVAEALGSDFTLDSDGKFVYHAPPEAAEMLRGYTSSS